MANPTYFQERKDFLNRLVKDVPRGAWQKEMGFTKKLFNEYPHDFLAVVSPPFANMNSIAYFMGAKGKDYLKVQLNKFKFKPKVVESVIQERVKEEVLVSDIKSIREFLNE